MPDYSTLVDPQFKPFLEGLMHVPGARSFPSVTALREATNAMSGMFPPSGTKLAKVENRTIPGPDGDVPVRIYTPHGTGPFPVVLYYHGGGWVICNLDTHDGLAREFCAASGAIVMSVDYRLAPEHKFPAGMNDCWAALKWVAANAGEINGDADRLAAMGDSAGGVLAVVMSLRAHDEGGPKLSAVINYYGSCNYPSAYTPSANEHANAPVVTRDDIDWFYEQYLTDPATEQNNPYVSPIRAASLKGVAPTFIATADLDPSRDDAEAYGVKLREAGGDVKIKRYKGMLHGFLSWIGPIDAAKTAIDDGAAWLARHWDGHKTK